jgi:hypothetical protein
MNLTPTNRIYCERSLTSRHFGFSVLLLPRRFILAHPTRPRELWQVEKIPKLCESHFAFFICLNSCRTNAAVKAALEPRNTPQAAPSLSLLGTNSMLDTKTTFDQIIARHLRH